MGLLDYAFDPYTSPYFRPQDQGSGSLTMGSGDGTGWYDWTKVLGLGYTAPTTQDQISGGRAPDVASLLTQAGYKPTARDAVEGGAAGQWRAVVDAQGNAVGPETWYPTQDASDFWTAALLAAGLVTGGVANWANAGGAAAGTTAGGTAAGAGEAGALTGVGQYGSGMAESIAAMEAAAAGVPALETVAGTSLLGTIPQGSGQVAALEPVGTIDPITAPSYYPPEMLTGPAVAPITAPTYTGPSLSPSIPAPSTPATDAPKSPSPSFTDDPLGWLKANPDWAKLLFTGGGALLSGLDGGGGGGGGYVDSGYRPTINRNGFAASVTPTLLGPQRSAPGLLTTGNPDDGLWRFLRGGK